MATSKARQYVMENEGEAQRLESQSTMRGYLLEEELHGLIVKPDAKILDAGCGTGLAARYLAGKYPSAVVEGCDLSSMRLQSARNLAKETGSSEIRYFESSLEHIRAEDAQYDLVICRYVFEHMADARLAANEFHRVLRPGGAVRVIDFDGIIYNLYPMSVELVTMTEKVKMGLGTDLYIGRKIPSMLVEAGFKNVQCATSVVDFQGRDLESERELTYQRLTFAIPLMSAILGSETQAMRFRELYCDEMKKAGATLFYNKFVVTGLK